MRKKTPKLAQVNARLLAEDVAEIKRRAAAELIPWGVKLRLLVHLALKDEKRKPEVR